MRAFVRIPKHSWVEFLNEKGEVIFSGCLSEALKVKLEADKKQISDAPKTEHSDTLAVSRGG